MTTWNINIIAAITVKNPVDVDDAMRRALTALQEKLAHGDTSCLRTEIAAVYPEGVLPEGALS